MLTAASFRSRTTYAMAFSVSYMKCWSICLRNAASCAVAENSSTCELRRIDSAADRLLLRHAPQPEQSSLKAALKRCSVRLVQGRAF
jgi:hypothetical protein